MSQFTRTQLCEPFRGFREKAGGNDRHTPSGSYPAWQHKNPPGSLYPIGGHDGSGETSKELFMNKEEILEFVQNEMKFAERLAAMEMVSKFTAAASLAGIVLIIGMIWSMNHNLNARITGLENSFTVFDKRLSAVEIAVTK